MMSARHSSRPSTRLAVGLLVACALTSAGSSASALTRGSLAPPNIGGCGNCNTVQHKSAPGLPSYEVPPGKWRIISWSAQGGGTAAGQVQLRIYRRTDVEGQLRFIKQSTLKKVPANRLREFKTNLTVKGGDLLGMYTVANVAAGYPTLNDKDLVWVFSCVLNPGDLVGTGTDCALNPLPRDLVNIKVRLSRIE